MTDVSISQTLVIGHIWQSVALAGVLALVLILGKRMRGSTRYSLGVAAFVASLALPLAAFIPGETIVASLLKQLSAPVAVATVEAPAPTTAPGPVAGEGGAVLVPVNSAASASPASMFDAPPIYLAPSELVFTPAAAPLFTLPEIKLPDIGLPLLLIWLGVALVLIARTIRDLVAVERLVARAVPAVLPAALQDRMKGVRVLVSPEAPGPMAAGLLRPCIVMPESIALGSPGMAGLLEHEHAHIRRRDILAALGQRLVLSLLWWSPALYWMSRRIDEEREVACDEAAVDRTGDAKAFARSLTKQAENQLWVRAPRLAVGAIGPRSHFGRRVRRLIDMAKTGGTPAKYSGRLAFAGLVLAVGVAAMVTPRFTAEAQPPESAIDLTAPDAAEKARQDEPDLAAGAEGSARSFAFDFDSQDFAGLGADIEALMAELEPELEGMLAELGPELEGLLAGLGPELEGELAGLSGEMAALGLDIAAMVSQDMMAEMPQIMEDVRQSLEEAGIDPESLEDWQDLKGLSGEDMDDVRRALDEAREELRHALGPELRAEIQSAMAEARAEIASHRGEIAAALGESRIGMAAAKDALAAARKEIEAARARGDFRNLKPTDFDFDFERDVLNSLREAGIDLDGPDTPAPLRINGRSRSGLDLYHAAGDCDVKEISRLVVNADDVNRIHRGDGTPLIAAAREGCEEGVRLLLNAGADPNLASPGDGTPLIAAVSAGRNAVTRLLLERGADANGYAEGDETPLIQAAGKGSLELTRILVEHGADVNLAYNVEVRSGRTELRSPLNTAERRGHDGVVRFLKERGAISAPKSAN